LRRIAGAGFQQRFLFAGKLRWMFTEDESRRLLQIIKESAGQPRGTWIDRAEREIPHANAANIRMALNTLLELGELDKRDAEAKMAALENMMHALKRATALSGVDDMTVADALARGGNVEAQKLLSAFDDPFADLNFLRGGGYAVLKPSGGGHESNDALQIASLHRVRFAGVETTPSGQ
jgi:hypothetical protein